MYPRRYLGVEDLPAGAIVTVVIKGLRTEEWRGRAAPGQKPVVETKLVLDLYGYKLPIRMNVPMLKKLEKILGTEDPAQWRDRQLNIYAGEYDSYGEMKPGIIFDDRPPVPTTTVIGQGAQRPSLLTAAEGFVPADAIERFRETAASMAGSWDAFLKWCRTEHVDAFALVAGVDFDQVPARCMKVMKAYLDSLADAKPAALPPPPPESPASPSPSAQTTSRTSIPFATRRPTPPPQSIVGEEDIPF